MMFYSYLPYFLPAYFQGVNENMDILPPPTKEVATSPYVGKFPCFVQKLM